MGALGGVQISNIPFILKFLKFKIPFHFIAFDLGSVGYMAQSPRTAFLLLFVILGVPSLNKCTLLGKNYG